MLLVGGVFGLLALSGVVALYAAALRQVGWLRDNWPG